MVIIIFKIYRFLCLFVSFYLVQCVVQKRAGFISTLSGFPNRTKGSEPVEDLEVSTLSNTYPLANTSRFKPLVPSTKILQGESTLQAPITDVWKVQSSQESALPFSNPDFSFLSPCEKTVSTNFNSANSPCFTTINNGQIVIDCSGLSQENINPAWFPANANVILLDNNRFTAIQNCTFSHLQDLRSLSLSGNKIKDIEIDAFRGLSNLESLNLDYNQLGYQYLQPPNVFKSLTKLKELLIQHNDYYRYEDCMPGNVFGSLAHLENLTVNTVGYRLCFAEEFAELTHLQQLSIYGKAKNINEKSFENVQQITSLYLNSMILTNFSEIAFEPFKKLDVLYLHGVRTGVDNLLLALKPFRGRNMTVIYLDSISMFEHDSYPGFIKNDGVLTFFKTQYLLEVCVREFTLSFSEIYVIQENAFRSDIWERCLVKLDLSANPLLGTKAAFIRLLNFKNIEMINMDNMMRRCFSTSGENDDDLGGTEFIDDAASTPTQLSCTVASDISYHSKPAYSTRANEEDNFFSNTKQSAPTKSKKQPADTCKSTYSPTKFVWVTVSNSLQRLQLHASLSSTRVDINAKFIGAQSLTYLDVGRGKLYKFRGIITGLDALQTLILSENDLSSLSEAFFDSFCHLEELDLSDCSLGVDFISRYSDRLLRNLLNLKRLDISLNLLNSLATDTFTVNRELEMLNLAKNRFRTIPFNLRNIPNLKVLDIRKNSLSTIELGDRELLDILAKQPDGFKLLLSGNEISCDCDNFRFLHWLTTTHVQLDDITITCFDVNNNTTSFGLFVDVDRFFRKCLGGFFLTVAISLFLLIVIGFLVFFFVLKHKLFIRSAILKVFTGYKLKAQSDYRIGVFIGYSEHDYAFPCFDLRTFIEDELGLNTYLYHRDMNGPDMAKSIVDAINASWRIILVVNSSFLFQDEWSAFTYTTAIYSQTWENPSRIVVLVDTSLQHLLPAEILSAVNDDNIIVVPDWELTSTLQQQLTSRLIQ